MAIQILMPALSPGMKNGKLVKWLVKEGQHVSPGDVIAQIDADGTQVEVEAVDKGTVSKLLVLAGTADIWANTPIALLDATGNSTRDDSFRLRSRIVRLLQDDISAPAPPPAAAPTKAAVRQPLPGDYVAAAPQGPQSKKILQSIPTAERQPDQGEPGFVAGWVVVLEGPGRGQSRPVYMGMNTVGRASNQRVSLDFGDDSIAAEEHAYIVYDDEARRFYLQHGGKATIIRVNSNIVLTPTEIPPQGLIRIGKTTLRFIPFCGGDFSWTTKSVA